MAATVVKFAEASLARCATDANAAHAQALKASASALRYALASGKALLAAKAQLPHGKWLPWRKEHCPDIGERSAQVYMRLARSNPQRDSDLSIRQAVQLLAADASRTIMGSRASDEFYSPANVLELVQRVMGMIDLDPAYHPRSLVKARRTYTKADDGLKQRWRGRVYLNPPYSQMGDWIRKLIKEFEAGNVTQAIALLPARTDAAWFRLLDRFPRCFIHGRIRYSNSQTSAPFPCVVIFLGRNNRRFAREFRKVGTIFVRLED